MVNPYKRIQTSWDWYEISYHAIYNSTSKATEPVGIIKISGLLHIFYLVQDKLL